MGGSIAHPRAPDRTESPLDRLVRVSPLVGMAGFLGFLEYLAPVHGAFALASLLYVCFLCFLVPPLWALVGGLVGTVRSAVGRDGGAEAADPRDWIESGYEPSPLKRVQVLVALVHPTIAIRGLAQVVGGAVAIARHRGRLPRPETTETAVTYRLPVEGAWTVVTGSPDRRYSHSWVPIRQRYAHDLVITDEDGRTHDGSGGLASFYCFDEPVLAPADGTVVRAKDGHRDHHRTSGWLDPLQYRLAGNYVLIRHAPGEYSFLAHLREGSVRVVPGESVTRGQELGRCGHSGNSTEPHLHVHFQDHPVPYLGAGLPVRFLATTERPATEEDGPTWIHCGQVVAPP